MKKFLIFIILVGIIGGVYFFFNQKNSSQSRCGEGFRFNPATNSCEPAQKDDREGIDFSTLKIKTQNGKEISLVQDGSSTIYNGKIESEDNVTVEEVSLDSSRLVAYDEQFVVLPYIYNSGGTGQFVYLGLFDQKTNTHVDAIVLGDRISVDTIQVDNGKVKVNFKDRLLSQSFAEAPTIPTQFVFEIKNNKIAPIAQLQNADYSDIEIKTPIAGSIINDQIIVKGAIPGTWYFEANAHFKILDETYKEIALGNIQALSDWMTTQKVPFELTIPVSSLNYKGNITIVIESENVQGDEEGEKNMKRLFIPVVIQ